MRRNWPTRLLLVSTPFYPSIGGVQSIVKGLAEQFTARGLEVTVMTSESSKEHDPFPFRVVRQPSAWTTWREFARADAVLQFGPGIRLGWPLSLKNFPVLTIHQNWLPQQASDSRLRRRLRQRMVRRSVNVCCSRALRQGVDAPAEVIGNPFEDNVFRRIPEIPRDHDIIFVGRLIPEKGAHVLLSAVAKLRAIDMNPSVTLVGEGPEAENLKRQAADLGLHRVQFAGRITGGMLASVLNAHRIMVVPSVWAEPFGIVVLEGIACGCRVIVSNSGGLPEALGRCGRTFEAGNADDLANALQVLLTDQDASAEAEAFQQHLSGFTIGTIADRYLQTLDRHFRPR